MDDSILTIFTPTYNRAYKLPKLYKTLCLQTCYDFEWIIIDDESVDDTESIVRKWMKEEKRFLIRYYKQKHGGKHRALNKGFDLAEGEFFFIVDSDDMLTTNAVALIKEWTTSIKERSDIAAVSGLKVRESGEVFGGNIRFTGEFIDAGNFERKKYNLLGDKAEVYKTDILRRHKFPEFEGEYFVTEDVCWLAIASEGYKIRWFNQPIYIAEYLQDGLTNNGANNVDGHRKNYKGYCFYVSECIRKKPFIEKMIHLKEYQNTAHLLKKGFRERAKDINLSMLEYSFYVYLGIPIGYIIRKMRLY